MLFLNLSIDLFDIRGNDEMHIPVFCYSCYTRSLYTYLFYISLNFRICCRFVMKVVFINLIVCVHLVIRSPNFITGSKYSACHSFLFKENIRMFSCKFTRTKKALQSHVHQCDTQETGLMANILKPCVPLTEYEKVKYHQILLYEMLHACFKVLS